MGYLPAKPDADALQPVPGKVLPWGRGPEEMP